MTRSLFLALAGILAMFFGLAMLFSPQQMLVNMAHDGTEARFVLQWMGVALLSVGAINLLARNDPGSPALRAVMIGNLVLHVLGFAIDFRQHLQGFVQASGVMMGGIVHAVLALGFAHYLWRPSAR